MKKKILQILFFAFVLSACNMDAQDSTSNKRIEKKIQVEKRNGKTTVTITEKNNGKTTTKKMTGEEAEEYLNDHKKETSFSSSDSRTGSKRIIIEEIEGGGSGTYIWMDGDNMEMEGGELTNELKNLRKDLSDLNMEEIEERMDKIIEMQEKMMEFHVVKMECLDEDLDSLREIIKEIEVDEKDGVIRITKRIGGVESDQEIIMDEGDGERIVYVTTSTSSDSDKKEDNNGSINNNMNVNIFPNPNEGEFTIEVEVEKESKTNVKVVDVSGKVVYDKLLSGKKKYSLDVKLKQPSNGIYVIIVEQGDKTIKLKTIIE
jgi:hypothetical protein